MLCFAFYKQDQCQTPTFSIDIGLQCSFQWMTHPSAALCWECTVLHQPPLGPSPTQTPVHMRSQKDQKLAENQSSVKPKWTVLNLACLATSFGNTGWIDLLLIILPFRTASYWNISKPYQCSDCDARKSVFLYEEGHWPPRAMLYEVVREGSGLRTSAEMTKVHKLVDLQSMTVHPQSAHHMQTKPNAEPSQKYPLSPTMLSTKKGGQ